MKIASNQTPTPRERMSHADQWRFDDLINATSGRRHFLARHHMERIFENIKFERNNQWRPVLEFLAARQLSPPGPLRIPKICGRRVLAYLRSDRCIFNNLERVKPVIEVLRRTWHPALADSVSWAVDAYIRAIAALRQSTPSTPPSLQREYVALLSLLVPQVDAALSDFEQAMVNALAKIPTTIDD